jgi:TonB-linked SusC/RagA family outer membrane protein
MTLGRWKIAVAGAALTLVSLGGQLAAQGATITGRIIAKEGGQPLPDARVIVIGTSASTSSAEDGKYTLRNVPPGSITLQVLRVGYRSLKRIVEVTAGGTATSDFTLEVAVAQLEEVVTTATGQARRVELGNAIATVDVAKAAEVSEISTTADMLTAKAPGVVVLPGSTLGGAPTVRVRGVSSISLSNAPIWVVDGVRIATDNLTTGTDTRFSLLNNLNPDEIEDIEIVKGPSAATLYGTDAANGVVVVTTKKGRAGASRWSFGGEYGNVDDRNDYPDMYANWGHTLGNPTKQVRCQLGTMAPPGTTPTSNNTCISDSVTHYNLLADPSRTFITLGNRKAATAQVSGGSDAVRYFASGSLNNEVGPIQMPGFDVQRFQSENVKVQDAWFHPLAQQQASFRTNLSASVSPKFDLTATAGFLKEDNRIEPESDLIIALLYTGLQNYGFKGPGLDKVTTQAKYADGTAVPLNDYLQWDPGDIMQATSFSDVQRMLGSFNASWRPLPWMANEGTVGLDLVSSNYFHLCALNQCPPQSATARIGNVNDKRQDNRNFSAKVVSTSSWNAKPWANLKTTFGVDYVNLELDSVSTTGQGLPPGATTVAAATTVTAGEVQPTVTKTLGVYAQEAASFRDRVFVTVAARSDQNSAFGTNFQRVLYPKASLSWLLSDESFFPQRLDFLSQFRVRASYGASGVQPGRTQGLITFAPGTVTIDGRSSTTGTDTPGLSASNPGNPNLKPERSAEFETGFETYLLSNRVHLDYTYYRKTTHDALISVPIAPSAGAAVTSLLENIGSTRNSGHELQLNAQLVDSRRFGWDMTITASHNTALIVDLGIDPSTGVARIIGAGGLTEQRDGQPIDAQWYHPYTYADANHDGVIQVSEVHVDSSFQNYGNAIPRDLLAINTGVDLFNHHLRLTSLFDSKGGYSTQDGADNFQCNSVPLSCQSTQDPHASLAQQAAAIAKTYGTTIGTTSFKSGAGYFMNGQFWKWREASAILQLPRRMNNLLRTADGSTFVFSARNLHLWSSFWGIDPESNYGLNGSELQNEFQTAPPPTYFVFRLNLKY